MLRRLLWWLPVAVLFWNLGYAAFWNPDEGRYVAAAYEMARPFAGARADWLVPHLNTVPRLNKPPLVYWASALSFRLFGVSQWSARLVPALASLLVLALIYAWGARVWDERVGFAAALVWSTSLGAATMGRIANTDMLLCAALALTMFGIFWAIELEGKQRLQMGAWAGMGMGLALLSKGPVGLALPLVFAALYLTVTRNWKRAPWGALMLALGIGLVIGAPWYLLVEMERPSFLKTFIFEENLGRFSGKKDFHNATSPFYYVPVVLVGLLPWTGFWLPTLAAWREADARAMRAKLFLAVWALALVGFFSLSSTKLISYALPAFPALALLLGTALGRFDANRTWNRAALALTLLFYGGLLVALTAIPQRDKATKVWSFAGVLLDDTIVPRAVGAPWTTALVVFLLVSGAALAWAWKRAEGRAILAVQGASALVLLAMLLGLAGTIARYEDVSQTLSNLRPMLRPGDRFASYRAFVPAAIPYIERPMMFFNFKNSSGLRPDDIARSRFYTTAKGTDDLTKWLAQPGRAFVITEGLKNDALTRQLYLWNRTNDFFVLCNQPLPPETRVRPNYVSPRRALKNRLFEDEAVR